MENSFSHKQIHSRCCIEVPFLSPGGCLQQFGLFLSSTCIPQNLRAPRPWQREHLVSGLASDMPECLRVQDRPLFKGLGLGVGARGRLLTCSKAGPRHKKQRGQHGGPCYRKVSWRQGRCRTNRMANSVQDLPCGFGLSGRHSVGSRPCDVGTRGMAVLPGLVDGGQIKPDWPASAHIHLPWPQGAVFTL